MFRLQIIYLVTKMSSKFVSLSTYDIAFPLIQQFRISKKHVSQEFRMIRSLLIREMTQIIQIKKG